MRGEEEECGRDAVRGEGALEGAEEVGAEGEEVLGELGRTHEGEKGDVSVWCMCNIDAERAGSTFSASPDSSRSKEQSAAMMFA